MFHSSFQFGYGYICRNFHILSGLWSGSVEKQLSCKFQGWGRLWHWHRWLLCTHSGLNCFAIFKVACKTVQRLGPGRLHCTWTETLEKHHAVEIWTFCTLLRSLWTVPNFKSGQLWLARGKTAQMNSAILFFHYFYFPDCCTKFTLVLGRFSYFALWGPIVLCEIGTSIQLLSHKNTCRFEDTVHLSQFLVIHTETHLTDDMMTLKVVFVV